MDETTQQSFEQAVVPPQPSPEEREKQARLARRKQYACIDTIFGKDPCLPSAEIYERAKTLCLWNTNPVRNYLPGEWGTVEGLHEQPIRTIAACFGCLDGVAAEIYFHGWKRYAERQHIPDKVLTNAFRTMPYPRMKLYLRSYPAMQRKKAEQFKIFWAAVIGLVALVIVQSCMTSF